MKIILYFLVISFCKITVAELTLSLEQLMNKSLQTSFFDPHNHINGVIPPLGEVNLEKYVFGQDPSISDLKNYWSNFINFYSSNNEIKNNPRVSNGTKMLLNCNDQQKIEDGIYNIFTSTPLNDFDSAYALRKLLKDNPPLQEKSSNLRPQAIIFALAQIGVNTVEMSKAVVGPVNMDDDTKDFKIYSELLDDLRSENTSKENIKLKNRLLELKLPIPEIKWLLMTNTLELGKVSPKNTVSYKDDRCLEMPMPEGLDTDLDGIFNILTKFSNVVGVDVAAPEITCFTNFGMENFKKLVETTRKAAIAKNAKLVVHVHVGEGFPLTTMPFYEDRSNSCEAINTWPSTKFVNNRIKQLPVHRIESEKNIRYILKAIEDIKRNSFDIDKHIVFRLAHVTHINSSLAKKAKKLGVSADVNLSSNIATGAWNVDPLIEKYLIKKGTKPIDVRNLLKSLIDNGATIEEIFDGHGLKWLLYHGVPVTLGSDGGGVEHVSSLRDEYLMAKKLIEYWNENDTNFAQKNISIDQLLKNQKRHYEAMGYDE